jgi:opacity protein-like surface antigen
MVKYFKRLSLAGFAAMLSTAGFAADLPAPVIEHIPQVPVAGGWYLRGDIGYKVYRDPDLKYGTIDFYDESIDNTFMVGAGVGYKFNNHFRADFTIDYEFPATVDAKGPCSPCVAPGYSVERADLDVWTFMLNGYVDIGTWYNITPYVGAGLGASYVSANDINFRNPDGTTGTYPSGSKWNLAWALMAGASYDLTPNWSLDAGYRYLNIGSGRSGTFTTAGQTSHIKYEDLSAHEFRLGARYTFNTVATPSYYAPQPPITSNF